MSTIKVSYGKNCKKNTRGAKAGINKIVTPHRLRHRFAAPLLEQGTDLRYIQKLLGPGSSKQQGYSHVSKRTIDKIKNPADAFFK